MTTFTPIPLDDDWRCYPPEDGDAAFGGSMLDESAWDALAALSEWPRHRLPGAGTLHLRRRVDLDPIGDVCLRYRLRLERAPAGTNVTVNGWHVGTVEAGGALEVDVTDALTLEGNVILLKVTRRGEISGVSLLPVPCGDG
jgi:hypothetical protein